MTVIGPELANKSHDHHVLATSYKDAAVARGCENEAILTVVNVDIGSDIEHEVKPSFAVVDIELFPFERVHHLDFELVFFVLELEIIGVEILFKRFAGQDIVLWFGLWLLFLRLLLFHY